MVSLTTDPLDLTPIHRYLRSPLASCEVFVTLTVHGDAPWIFEARMEEALAAMHAIADAMRTEAVKVALVHRLGPVAPEEIYLIIGVSAKSHAAALAHCESASERFNRDVPVWKRVEV